MAKQADVGSKRLVSIAPDGWAQWITNLNDVTVIDLIDAQFQWVSRDSDVLIKAQSPEHGEFLILNEWQLYYDRAIDYRINAYAGLGQEKFRLPVYPVVINILRPSPGTEISKSFQSNFMGLQGRQDYKVINLWEVDAEIAFTESLAALLPLAPVMKGGKDETVLRRATVALEAEERFSDLQQLLGIFATLVFGVDLVERVMSLQAEAFRASPWAEVFMQKGEQKGKQEGKQEEALRMLNILIQGRFGDVSESVEAVLHLLSTDQLEKLAKMFLQSNSLDEFIAYVARVRDEN